MMFNPPMKIEGDAGTASASAAGPHRTVPAIRLPLNKGSRLFSFRKIRGFDEAILGGDTRYDGDAA